MYTLPPLLSSPCPHPFPLHPSELGWKLPTTLANHNRYVTTWGQRVPSAEALLPLIQCKVASTREDGLVQSDPDHLSPVRSSSSKQGAMRVCSSSPHRVIDFTPPRQHHLLPAQHTSYLSYPQHRVGMAERRRRRPVPVHKRGSLKTRPRCQPKAARSFEPDGCGCVENASQATRAARRRRLCTSLLGAFFRCPQ